MKSIYLSSIIIILIFAGCSSTYNVSDFTSKENFYKDFNNSVKDRNVEITFKNDSSFNTNNRVEVEGDSLYSLNPYINKSYAKISLSRIKEITYTGNNNSSALLTVKDGEKLQAENLQPANDSLAFIKVSTLYTITAIAPLDKLKTVSYKNRLWGLPEGFLIGVPSGFVLGIMIGSSLQNTDTNQSNSSSIYEVFGPYIGAIVGSFAGWLIGRNYIYQFNP